ncbi:hypothetical protein T265_15690, partial [Opisthorchis viverrini]
YKKVQFENYKIEASATKALGAHASSAVGNRQLEGRINTDVLRIGEYIHPGFTFQMIEKLQWRPYFLDHFSGKLGLAPVSEILPETFAQSLLRLFPQEPVFTLWFRPDEDGEYRNGIFSFGGVHDYRYDGQLLYFPVVFANSWIIQATKISLGEDVVCQQDCNIQFSTAVPYFYGPREQINQIHRLLNLPADGISQGENILNCDKADSYPQLHVQFGSLHVHWRMDEIWETKRDRKSFVCKSGIRTNIGLPGWECGHKLMYKLFAVYDLRNARIGLADASRP